MFAEQDADGLWLALIGDEAEQWSKLVTLSCRSPASRSLYASIATTVSCVEN